MNNHGKLITPIKYDVIGEFESGFVRLLVKITMDLQIIMVKSTQNLKI